MTQKLTTKNFRFLSAWWNLWKGLKIFSHLHFFAFVKLKTIIMPKLGCFRKVEVKALREKVDNVASTNLKFTRSKISFSFVSIIDTFKFFHSWQGFSKGNRSDESFPFFRPFKTVINNQWVFHAESPLSFKLILFVFCVIETQ